jgi:hypothetical protein
MAGAVEAAHAVLLVNLEPLREVYASVVLAMGGIVQTPSGPFRGPRKVGSSSLRYLMLARTEGRHPNAAGPITLPSQYDATAVD